MNTQPSETIQAALIHGEYELKGQFMLGSNYTFLADVHHEGKTYPAVYKPSKGEQPLWDFPEFTLALREVAAYQLSEVLGLHIVPFTTYRQDGPYGAGSLQQYVEYDIEHHYFNFTDEEKEKLRPVVFFDLLANNADRKGGHVFFEEETHKLFAIDHGICFHEEEKLRTVIWDFAGEQIPQELLTPLSQTDSWSSVLGPYLNPSEIKALLRRAERLCKSKVFPRPLQGRRAYPYPPV
jgi:uncharacterized repeat protein (TIGR03843 family)